MKICVFVAVCFDAALNKCRIQCMRCFVAVAAARVASPPMPIAPALTPPSRPLRSARHGPQGDLAALRKMPIAKEMLERFTGLINASKAEGLVSDSQILDVSDLDVVEARAASGGGGSFDIRTTFSTDMLLHCMLLYMEHCNETLTLLISGGCRFREILLYAAGEAARGQPDRDPAVRRAADQLRARPQRGDCRGGPRRHPERLLPVGRRAALRRGDVHRQVDAPRDGGASRGGAASLRCARAVETADRIKRGDTTLLPSLFSLSLPRSAGCTPSPKRAGRSGAVGGAARLVLERSGAAAVAPLSVLLPSP